MEKNRIKRFNENSELNISDVSDSKFSLKEVGMVLDWLREFVREGGNIHDEKTWEEWKEEALMDLKDNK